MNIQVILVIVLFAAAIFYIGRMMYKSLTAKKAVAAIANAALIFRASNRAKQTSNLQHSFIISSFVTYTFNQK